SRAPPRGHLQEGGQAVEKLAKVVQRPRAAVLVLRGLRKGAQARRGGGGKFLHETLDVRGIVDELLAPTFRDVEDRGLALRWLLELVQLLDDRRGVDVAHQPADV